MSEAVVMDELKAAPLPDDKLYWLYLPPDYADPDEESLRRIQERFEAVVPGGRLVIFPPGAKLYPCGDSQLTPYAFTETLDGYSRTVHFATHAELMAHIAAVDSKRLGVNP